jgi:hypothetical protein
LAEQRSLPVHWGSVGFSLNADIDGTHVAICIGYEPRAVFGQTIRTTLFFHSGPAVKAAVPEETLNELWRTAKSTGLFVPSGRDLKCRIDRSFGQEDVESIISWITDVQTTIEEHGLGE